MGKVNKFNHEGYYDPTAYEALKRIETAEKAARKADAFRPVVYICSPYAGDIEGNTYRAQVYSRFAVTKHAVPIAPHLLFPQFMNDDTERELALFMGIILLTKCKEMWVFGTTVSDGMLREIEKAKQMGKIIRYFNEELEEITDEHNFI